MDESGNERKGDALDGAARREESISARNAGSVQSHSAQAHSAQASEQASGLIHTIEGEVIPRLLLAHQSMLREEAAERASSGAITWDGTLQRDPQSVHEGIEDRHMPSALSVTQADIVAFAELLIAFEPKVAQRFISAQIARGHDVSDLLLDLCAPAARELGDMWLRDDCSFCDVTVGLSSLEHVITQCSAACDTVPNGPDRERTALLTAMPGNQHVFGLLIVKELFRRSGWIVRSPQQSEPEVVLRAVRKTRFSVLGISVGNKSDLEACQALIKACRSESLNPKLLIVVGGHGIQEVSMSTRTLDADLIARDGREGLDQIERMIARVAQPRNYN